MSLRKWLHERNEKRKEDKRKERQKKITEFVSHLEQRNLQRLKTLPINDFLSKADHAPPETKITSLHQEFSPTEFGNKYAIRSLEEFQKKFLKYQTEGVFNDDSTLENRCSLLIIEWKGVDRLIEKGVSSQEKCQILIEKNVIPPMSRVSSFHLDAQGGVALELRTSASRNSSSLILRDSSPRSSASRLPSPSGASPHIRYSSSLMRSSSPPASPSLRHSSPLVLSARPPSPLRLAGEDEQIDHKEIEEKEKSFSSVGLSDRSSLSSTPSAPRYSTSPESSPPSSARSSVESMINQRVKAGLLSLPDVVHDHAGAMRPQQKVAFSSSLK